jgi:hypothetical protein
MKDKSVTPASSYEAPDSWIGFDSRQGRLLAGEITRTGDVLPAGYIAIAMKPQLPFRGTRLFVHQPIASAFLIHSLRVGHQEQMASAAAPIPADAFATRMDALAQIDELFARDKVIEIKVGKTAAELLGAPWILPVAQIGMEITIAVENISDRPRRFLAGMLGKVQWQ